MDTLSNVNGCDSVITVNLTVNTTSYSSQTITACDSLISPSGNSIWYNSGTYVDTLSNVNGCDSVITLNLTINATSYSSQTITACDSLVSPSGNSIWYNSGTYLDTLSNVVGCDSIVATILTINQLLAEITVIDDTTLLSSGPAGSTYQWIDCSNGNVVLTGETNQSYTASTNGDYAVIVTMNGCSDTSSCSTINSVNLDEINAIDRVALYPNPTNDNFTIEFETLPEGSYLEIHSIDGKMMHRTNISSKQTVIGVQSWTKGVYIVQVISSVQTRTIKLVID